MATYNNVIKTIIAEAASEGEEGMYAVASVIVNRAKARKLTPEQTVNQPHQFTGRWRKDLDGFVAQQPTDVLAAAQRAWERATIQPIEGIDHYMTTALYESPKRPSWAESMGTGQRIGRHVFLKSKGGAMKLKPASKEPRTIPGTVEEAPTTTTDPIEAGIMRIGRLTHAAGFGMLTAKDIEPILAKVSPPGLLPGVKPDAPDPDSQEREMTSFLHKALHQGRSPSPEASSMAKRPMGQPQGRG